MSFHFFPSDSIFSNERIETGENWTIALNGDKRSQCISAVQQRLDLLTFDRNNFAYCNFAGMLRHCARKLLNFHLSVLYQRSDFTCETTALKHLRSEAEAGRLLMCDTWWGHQFVWDAWKDTFWQRLHNTFRCMAVQQTNFSTFFYLLIKCQSFAVSETTWILKS